MRKMLNELEQERIFLVNETTSVFPEGGGQSVRQVAIEAPDDSELQKFRSTLEGYNLSEVDQSKLEAQLLKRYYEFKWDYRLIVEHTPISEDGDRLTYETTIMVTDTSHILERNENFEEKEEATEIYLSVGGNMSSFSYDPSSPHSSDPDLSYSSLFKSDPVQ